MSRFILLSLTLIGLSIVAYGQDFFNNPCKKPEYTIGFQTGVNTFLSNRQPRKGKYYRTNGLYVRKCLGKHFAIESSFNFATQYNNILSPDKPHDFQSFSQNKTYTVTIPVVVQYYLLPKFHKFRPYLGAGTVYLYNPVTPIPYKPQDDVLKPHIGCNGAITISVVQGIKYEVNTRIEFNESLHIEPMNDKINTFGLNLGIGINL